MSEYGERKPDLSQLEPDQTQAKPEKIGIVVDYQGEHLKLQLKSATSLRKVFEAAAKKFNKDLAALRFTFDGNRLQSEDTPDSVGLEEGDVIDAHLEQLGGAALAL